MVFMRWITTAATLAMVAGCGGGPAPEFYILGSTNAAPAPVTSTTQIGLAEIALPSYARKDAIASRSGEHRIVLDDANRWASPPSELLTATLSEKLEQQTGFSVVARPYPSRFDPDIQLSVSFDRFLRNPDGGVDMAGQFVVLRKGEDDGPHIERFAQTISSYGTRYEDYMRSVSQGVDRLSEMVSDVIRKQMN